MKVKGVCFADCWDACAVILEKADKLKIYPDSSNPYTRNFLCQRLYRFLRDKDSDKRILYPLIRINGKLTRASWDDILDLLSERLTKLKEKGKESSILLGVNTGNAGIFQRLSALRFFSLYGEITLMDGNLCDDAGNFAHELDFGACFNHPPQDILNSKTAIIWGRNPSRTNIHFIPFIEEAKRKGTFIYLIDPIKTETANFVNKHIAVKPGRDIYLAMAIAKVILEKGWEDKAFIESKTKGFEGFLKLLEGWSLRELSEKCDVNLKDIEEIAESLSFNKPVSIWQGMGAQHYSHGVSTFRMINALSALSGNLGIRGGGVSFSHYSVTSFQLSWTKPKHQFRTIPKACLTPALRKETTEILWIQSFNLFNQTQNIGELKELANKIPLKVAIEFRWNETTELADVILPCATYLEKDDFRGSFWTPIIGYLPKIFEPKGEALDEWSIYKELSKRLGFEKEFGEMEEIIEEAFLKLKPLGITPSLVKEKGWVMSPLFPEIPFEGGKFLTEDGKFHFASELKLPEEDLSENYPFFLITPKALTRTNSQRPMERNKQTPTCLINPCWKEKYPYEEAYLVSNKGRLRVKLQFSPKVRPDLLAIDQGDTGINELCEERLAEDGRGASFFETKVKIERS